MREAADFISVIVFDFMRAIVAFAPIGPRCVREGFRNFFLD